MEELRIIRDIQRRGVKMRDVLSGPVTAAGARALTDDLTAVLEAVERLRQLYVPAPTPLLTWEELERLR